MIENRAPGSSLTGPLQHRERRSAVPAGTSPRIAGCVAAFLWRAAARRKFLLVALVLVGRPGTLSGQVRVSDFVITAGLTGEAWWGDFSAIAVPQFDSTESARAAVGEWSARGAFNLLNGSGRRVHATLDGGIRQSAAMGFQLRNYAPREQSGRLSMVYTEELGPGRLTANVTARSRRVIDHPPMPVYKTPGYDIYGVQAGYGKSVRTMNFELKLAGERADYKPPPALDHLDFLDRNSLVVEAVGERVFYVDDDDPEYFWALRLSGAYGRHSYPRQGEEILRVDNAMRLGTTFDLTMDRLEVTVTMNGTRSRSTSPRVEYNHGRLHVEAVWYWEKTDLSLTGTLARKRYTRPTQYALVAGEEADNASIFHAEISRTLGSRIYGGFRLGWRKVETNFSGAYYTRFGGGFSLRVRPWG